MPSFLLLALIFSIAAFAIGLTGYGFGLLAMGVLPYMMDVASANALVAVLALPVTISAVLPLRRSVDLARLVPMLCGALIGIPFGVLYLVRIDESIVRISLGAIILLAVAVSAYSARRGNAAAAERSLEAPSLRRSPGRWFGVVGIGMVSGSFGGAFSVSGPPVVLYLNDAQRDKTAIKATLLAYFTFVIASRLPFLATSGILTGTLLLRALALLPFVAAGLFVGTRLHNRLPSETIRRVIQVLLAISAVLLLSGAV
jgi:uncharacterized membrane protein YfcA